ncbi:hypothetical protein E5163_04140 [Marinicauda algicola]|uniref:Uncharacterized protein n=1 Tax=Marinicauda algicola TaxID=2029849 RepID=A0A4S2H406_9PROT|nr:hypothetical protein [Marinicauda algicola]TGY90324.1 hypothetical protein E5163_04140 [Marinicauda algicola]
MKARDPAALFVETAAALERAHEAAVAGQAEPVTRATRECLTEKIIHEARQAIELAQKAAG